MTAFLTFLTKFAGAPYRALEPLAYCSRSALDQPLRAVSPTKAITSHPPSRLPTKFRISHSRVLFNANMQRP